ncbi:quinon protein alcohol dehydrogenase-like superfamily [Lasiosphaeria ovina]|uniref:Quinon protein alcohol dehydrogenase-like superfamily n=1 Tax=Lasiosphaeria ovina TaxID=92902 RepID=A0AAE0N8A3_9PEZI|nr:quinon protein alcohol dehydrogenase-like superfamily [Lasiosphaeria ovina]
MKRLARLIPIASVAATFIASANEAWSGWGGSILNNHWAQTNTDITSTSIRTLALQCTVPDTVGQSAPPAFQDNYAYFPTWNGSFVALNYKTCHVKWRINTTQVIVDFAPITPLQAIANQAVARTSPQIDAANSVLFFGTQIHALVVAVDLATGDLLARKQANPHHLATITASPTLYDGLLFVGVSSGEENAAFFTGGAYECCSFIGNAAAFRFKRVGAAGGSFTTVWNVTTIPANLAAANGTGGRWSGAGIWGSQPPVDARRKQVIFATGNIYSIPLAYVPCSQSDDPSCLPSYIWQESVFALDMYTGRANWVRRLNKLDAWSLTCGALGSPQNFTLCPQKPGNDYAVDQQQPVGRRVGRDGSLLWQTPAPGANYSVSMPTAVGDVVVVGVTGTAGFSPPGPSALLALNKATGRVVFEYPIPGAWQGGVAVQDSYLFPGTGYKGGTGGAFYVFKVR